MKQPEKVCTGHYCQGERRPLSEFYVHKSGYRKGKPFSRCKRCWRYQVDHPQGKLRDRVPMHRFMPVYDELVSRIGQTQAARRIGVALETISRRRLSVKVSVEPDTFERAVVVLEEARRNGENGWSTDEARIANLRPQIAGVASGLARRVEKVLVQWPLFPLELAQRVHEDALPTWTLRDIDNYIDKLALEHENALDKVDVEHNWAMTDGQRYPFADFECVHGRLPGDKSRRCGCWPFE